MQPSRDVLAERFSELAISAQPADAVSRIVDFGRPAPIDLQVLGSCITIADRHVQNGEMVGREDGAELRGLEALSNSHRDRYR